jgi:hypothetical protein
MRTRVLLSIRESAMLWLHVNWPLIMNRARAISAWMLDEWLDIGSETDERMCVACRLAHYGAEW